MVHASSLTTSREALRLGWCDVGYLPMAFMVIHRVCTEILWCSVVVVVVPLHGKCKASNLCQSPYHSHVDHSLL